MKLRISVVSRYFVLAVVLGIPLQVVFCGNETAFHITDVEPAEGERGTAVTVSVYGQFFPRIAKDVSCADHPGYEADSDFRATLGKVPVGQIRWVDVSRLEMVVPDSLLPGIYDLEVTNPSGHKALLVDAYTIVDGGRQEDAGTDTDGDAGVGQGEWGKWNYCRKLSFDDSALSQSLWEFPVPILLNGERIDYGATGAGGADLRFWDRTGKERLPHEIENWNVEGSSVVWVRVPRIDPLSQDDAIWMCYGNPDAEDGQAPARVWDDGFLAVWHLADPVGSLQARDSVEHRNGFFQNDPLLEEPGLFGDVGVGFDGIDDHVDVGRMDIRDPSGALGADSATLEVVGTLEPGAHCESRMISKAVNIGDEDHWFMLSGFNGSLGNCRLRVRLKIDGTTALLITEDEVLKYGERFYAAAVYDGEGIDLYMNGQPVARQAAVGRISTAPEVGVALGANPESLYMPWKGILTEARISNVARSADWLSAQQMALADELVMFHERISSGDAF